MTPMVHVSISPKQKSAVNVPLTSSQNGFLDCITRISYHRKLKKRSYWAVELSPWTKSKAPGPSLQVIDVTNLMLFTEAMTHVVPPAKENPIRKTFS